MLELSFQQFILTCTPWGQSAIARWYENVDSYANNLQILEKEEFCGN